MTGMIDLEMSEQNVEGTIFDPVYFLRHWEETRGALWVWSEWAQPMYGQWGRADEER
jgi:hypothetical protein